MEISTNKHIYPNLNEKEESPSAIIFLYEYNLKVDFNMLVSW